MTGFQEFAIWFVVLVVIIIVFIRASEEEPGTPSDVSLGNTMAAGLLFVAFFLCAFVRLMFAAFLAIFP